MLKYFVIFQFVLVSTDDEGANEEHDNDEVLENVEPGPDENEYLNDDTEIIVLQYRIL